jgi:3-oxoacyl-ACP reductase-like protein
MKKRNEARKKKKKEQEQTKAKESSPAPPASGTPAPTADGAPSGDGPLKVTASSLRFCSSALTSLGF